MEGRRLFVGTKLQKSTKDMGVAHFQSAHLSAFRRVPMSPQNCGDVKKAPATRDLGIKLRKTARPFIDNRLESFMVQFCTMRNHAEPHLGDYTFAHKLLLPPGMQSLPPMVGTYTFVPKLRLPPGEFLSDLMDSYEIYQHGDFSMTQENCRRKRYPRQPLLMCGYLG